MTSASHDEIEAASEPREPEESFAPPAEEAKAEEAKTGGAPSDPAEAAKKLEAELNDLRDKHLRLFAEFENFRRRSAKESFELTATANARLIGRLTEVLENFRRAFDPKLKGTVEEFEKGFRLIHSRLKEILEEEGLEEIDPQGAEFDPNLHEALLQQPSDKVPENRVIETVQRGYKLKAKILAHAKVIVSKGKGEG